MLYEVITQRENRTACVLGWISYFSGLDPERMHTVEDVAEFMGYRSQLSFYEELDELGILFWRARPDQAAEVLFKYSEQPRWKT